MSDDAYVYAALAQDPDALKPGTDLAHFARHLASRAPGPIADMDSASRYLAECKADPEVKHHFRAAAPAAPAEADRLGSICAEYGIPRPGVDRTGLSIRP